MSGEDQVKKKVVKTGKLKEKRKEAQRRGVTQYRLDQLGKIEKLLNERVANEVERLNNEWVKINQSKKALDLEVEKIREGRQDRNEKLAEACLGYAVDTLTRQRRRGKVTDLDVLKLSEIYYGWVRKKGAQARVEDIDEMPEIGEQKLSERIEREKIDQRIKEDD